MRLFMTWTLVLLLSLSLTTGCKKKKASSSNGVADNGTNSGGTTGGGADAGMSDSGMSDSGMSGPGMEGGDPGEGDDDLAAGFEGEDEFDPADEGMEEDDLAAGFEGPNGELDPADDGTDDDLATGFEGTDEGADDTGGFADPGGTTDPGNFGGGQQGASRKPATLAEAAKQSLARGQSQDGFNYAFAAVLVDPKAGPELLNQYQWVNGLRRPVLGVRWGIGVQFIGSKEAASKPYPIGVKQKLPEKRSANRNRGGDPGNSDDFGANPGVDDVGIGGGFAGPGAGGGQGGNSELTKYTGDLGDKVIQRLQSRIERGYYGAMLKTALAGGGATAGQGNPGGGGIGPGAGGFDPADEGFDPADEGIGGGFADPGFGGGGRSGSRASLPGVTILGVGTLDQLAEKAQQSDLDVAIIFEVKVLVNTRTKLVTNNTTIQLYDVHEGKVVKKNKTVLNNVKIQIKSKTAKGNEVDEMIEKEIDQIFLAAETYRVQAMPALTPKLVLDNRVVPMVAKDYENPLPVLAELRFWHSRRLLTTEHLAIACKQLLDETLAKQLLSGDAKAQESLVKSWLPGGAAAQERSSTPFR